MNDSFIIIDTEDSRTLREVMNYSAALQTKLDLVIGEAHTAVKGYVVGYRDGSQSTLERCRELGQAISASMYHRQSGHADARVKTADEFLAIVEKKWRDKGHRLPYDVIPSDSPTAVEQMAKAIDNIIVREAIRKI